MVKALVKAVLKCLLNCIPGPAGRVAGVGVGAHRQQGAHRLQRALPRRQQQRGAQLMMAYMTDDLSLFSHLNFGCYTGML